MKRNVIPEKRKQFLLENFVEYGFEQDENGEDRMPDKQLFDSITDPAEIYFIAERCNWDDGAIVPRWIIDSPLCTKAAALIIFWTSAPDEYMEYNFGHKIPRYMQPDETDEEQTSILNLLEKLVHRFEKNEFCDYQIKFDFEFWGCTLHVDSPKWQVGPEFYKSIAGVEVA